MPLANIPPPSLPHLSPSYSPFFSLPSLFLNLQKKSPGGDPKSLPDQVQRWPPATLPHFFPPTNQIKGKKKGKNVFLNTPFDVWMGDLTVFLFLFFGKGLSVK